MPINGKTGWLLKSKPETNQRKTLCSYVAQFASRVASQDCVAALACVEEVSLYFSKVMAGAGVTSSFKNPFAYNLLFSDIAYQLFRRMEDSTKKRTLQVMFDKVQQNASPFDRQLAQSFLARAYWLLTPEEQVVLQTCSADPDEKQSSSQTVNILQLSKFFRYLSTTRKKKDLKKILFVF